MNKLETINKVARKLYEQILKVNLEMESQPISYESLPTFEKLPIEDQAYCIRCVESIFSVVTREEVDIILG